MNLRIQFSKTSAGQYANACLLVRKLGGTIDEKGAALLDLAPGDLKANRETLLKLCEKIYSWKSTELYLGDRQLKTRETLFYLRSLSECIDRYETTVIQDRYCRHVPATCHGDPIRSHSFGCRLLEDLSGHCYGYRDEDWWDCGAVDSEGIFHLNKNRLVEVLDIEAQRKCLYACPNFDFGRILEIVANEFPDTINPDVEKNWGYVTVNGRQSGIEPKEKSLSRANPMVRIEYVDEDEGNECPEDEDEEKKKSRMS